MTKTGADFTFSRPIADGVVTTFYFTYNTPPAGERNSSANPHTYTVGAVCITGAPTVSITSPLKWSQFYSTGKYCYYRRCCRYKWRYHYQSGIL